MNTAILETANQEIVKNFKRQSTKQLTKRLDKMLKENHENAKIVEAILQVRNGDKPLAKPEAAKAKSEKPKRMTKAEAVEELIEKPKREKRSALIEDMALEVVTVMNAAEKAKANIGRMARFKDYKTGVIYTGKIIRVWVDKRRPCALYCLRLDDATTRNKLIKNVSFLNEK